MGSLTGRRNMNIGALCETLTQVAESTRVPLTCVLVQNEGHIYKKTLLGNTQARPLNPAPSLGPADSRHAEGTLHLNGVPQRLRRAGISEIDQLGGQTMFAVGSLVKQALALTCGVMIEKGVIQNLTWETPVVTWIKSLYIDPKFIRHIDKEPNLTVRDLFLNNNALPPINQFLFLADGVCQITDEDFISYLDDVVDQSNQGKNSHDRNDRGGYRYTNANAILIALLLEKATRLSIDSIMKEHLFGPLEMTRTTLSRDRVMAMAKDSNESVSLGQRLSGDLTTAWSTAPKQLYSESTVFKMSVGMWSCTDDLAKFYNAVCKALNDSPGHISHAVVRDFFDASRINGLNGSEDIGVTPAGLLYRLETSDQGHESLNYTVRKQSGRGRQRQRVEWIEKDSDSVDYSVAYKGGTCDGFTTTTYLHIPTRKFAIVLSNASGPVDITEPIARYLLKAVVRPTYSFVTWFTQNGLQKEIREQLAMARSLWQRIEAEDRDFTAWPDDTEHFVGLYEHAKHKLQIEIRGGLVYFRRLRQSGPEVLTFMQIRASGNRLRLFPAPKGFFIDRLTFFRDLQLTAWTGAEGKMQLAANANPGLFVKM